MIPRRRAREAPGIGASSWARSREWIPLVAVLAVALALRLTYLAEIRGHPLFSQLTGDPAVYHAQALAILRGAPAPDHAFFHSSPLYPFFLAAVLRFGGPGLQAVRVLQALIGCATVGLVFVLGRLTIDRRAGLVAALGAALYVPFIFFEAEYLEITFVMAALAGMLILMLAAGRNGSLARGLAAGALLGAASLGKPNLLLFAPVGAVWLALSERVLEPRSGVGEGGEKRARGKGARKGGGLRLALGALFLAATVVVIAPATIHNYRTEGDLIPVSSNGGINLYIGNHPGAPGVFQVPPEMRFDLRVASKAAAERALSRELSAGEVSDYWAGLAFQFMRERPGEWLRQMARKFVLFWNHYEIPNHYHLAFVAESAPILRLPVGSFAIVAPLGLVGLGLALWRRREAGLLVAFGITFMASVLPFFITGRYRLAIVLPLLVGAGCAVSRIADAVRGRAWRTLAAIVAAVAILAVAVNVDTIEFGYHQMHNTVGAILGSRGDMEGAADAFGRALAENPADLSARRNLGVALYELGRYEEAAEHFRLAVRGHRGYHEAWIGLARALAALGRIDEAREALREPLTSTPPAPPAIRAEAEALLRSLGEPSGD
jgi:tetratricopeptide (TPR) repeat protein